MAGLLYSQFKRQIAKSKDAKSKIETEATTGYSTGYLAFDFLNGSVMYVNNVQTPYKYYVVGLTDGSMNMVIGRSGCGKTTFAVQAGCNIIRDYETSEMYHDDIEGGISEARRLTLSKFDPEMIKDKYHYRNAGITAENFYERVKMIADIKLNNREQFLYDTGYDDIYGERIYKMEPTVYLLDSVALLMPEKFLEEDEISGQMSATATAKMNSAVFKRIVPLLKAANIILIVINHINEKVEINAFKKTRLQVGFLKDGETLPGGRALIYLANNIIRFDDSVIKAKEGLGIDGYLVDVSLVKSRTNKAGKTVTLVFDQNNGYDPDLSLYIMLKQAGSIGSAGAYKTLGDYKFFQKDFKQLLNEDAGFRQAFEQACAPLLLSLVQESTTQETYGPSGVTQSLLNSLTATQLAA